MAKAMTTTVVRSSSVLAPAQPSLLWGTGTSFSSSCKPVVLAVGRRSNWTKRFAVRANADLLGDFGARDPRPDELGSNFGERILGHASTDHQILVPVLSVLSLSERSIESLPEGSAPLTDAEARALLRKLVGWRLINEDSSEPLKLQCDWILKDSDSVGELYVRLGKVTDAENYPHEMQTLENNKVRVEVWTPSIGA